MKIAYNPKTAAALTTAPANNDITFDLRGLNIFVRGEKFKGTDTTYSVFKKHTSAGSGGYNGLVPVPSYTATNIRFLREDGTWSIPAAAAAAFIYTQLTNQDLDDYLDEGKWYYAGGGNSVTNKPSGVDAFELYVGRNASGYRYQKLITSNGIIWFRYYDSTAWKTWVRWYTDQNTDQKVLQSATTTANFRPVILGYTNTSTPSDLSANVTQQVYTTTTIYAQPSTGSLWANKLYSGGKPVLTEHQSLANYVTLNTAQTITGVKTFSTGPILANNATITQNQNSTSNYTTVVKWLKGGTSQGTYNPSIGQHNTGGDGTGSICILPYPTSTDPWGGTVGLFISKGVLRLDGKAVAIAENYYTKTESDERYVNVTGDTMTGPLIVKASITGTQLISNIADGTAPLKVTSKTVVTNLNSDLLDGYHETSFFRARGSQTIASSIPTTTELSSNNNLSGNWNVSYPGASGHLIQFNTGSGSTRYMQFYSYYNGSLYWRNSTDSTLNTKSWKTIVDSANYTGIVLKIGTATKGSATLPIYLNAGTPTACSTTLGVSITGNAATARKLYKIDGTSRTWTTADSVVGNGLVSYTDTSTSGRWDSYGSIFQFSNADNPTPGTNGHWLTQIWSGTSNKLGVRWRTNTGSWSTMQTILTNTNYVSYADTRYVTALGTNGNYVTWTKNGTTNNLTVPYASYAGYLQSHDTRSVNNTPGQFSSGARFQFKQNSVDGLNNGGTYHGILHFKPYGGTTDFSGGQTHQLGFTDSGNLYMRTSTSSTAWGSWKLILNQNTADGRYVTLTTNQTVSGIKTFSTQQKFTVATGTSPFTVSSTTVVSNLNSDLLDGYHAASFYQYGYVMFARTIDASGLSTSTYYPVTFSIESHSNVRIECRVSLNSGTKPSWSTHTNGFSVRKIWEVNGSGWGTNPVNRRILVSDYAFADSDPVRGVGQLTNGSIEYVYVRGGGKYLFYISHNIGATLQTSTYTNNSQSVAPTTSAPAAISTPTLTFAAGKFSALSYKPITGVNTVYIPTNTSHLTNDSGFWTGTRYWADIAVSTSSSTGTSPTFSTAYTSNWFRSTGNTGWYSQTHGGGIYMTDTTYVRVYNGKRFYASGGYLAPYTGSSWITMATRTNCIVADQNNSASSAHALFRAKDSGGNAIAFGGLGGNIGFYGFTASRISNNSNGTDWSTVWNVSTGVITHNKTLYTAGYYHSSVNSNNYVLLAGGSYKSLADFAKGNAGASNRGVYVTNGTVTAMTYYLNATINSGSSGKLAYYSGTNSIDDYTSTIGGSSVPIYLSGGVPTACTGVLVKQYANYDIQCTGSSASFTRTNGNFSPISSVSRMDTGKVKINFASGYSWYNWFVIAVGKMRNDRNSLDNYTPCYVSLWSQYSSYLIASIQDDSSRNDGSFHFYILVF